TFIDVDLRTLVSDVETATVNLTFSVSGGTNGSVVLLGDGHTARFTPTGDYNGNGPSCSYSVSDRVDPDGSGTGQGAPITTGPVSISVHITTVNAPPTTLSPYTTLFRSTFIDVDLRTLVSDVETATVNLTFSVSGGTNGSVVLLGDGHTARFT